MKSFGAPVGVPLRSSTAFHLHVILLRSFRWSILLQRQIGPALLKAILCSPSVGRLADSQPLRVICIGHYSITATTCRREQPSACRPTIFGEEAYSQVSPARRGRAALHPWLFSDALRTGEFYEETLGADSPLTPKSGIAKEISRWNWAGKTGVQQRLLNKAWHFTIIRIKLLALVCIWYIIP